MKLQTLLGMEKRLRARLEYGSLGELIDTVRNIIIDDPFELDVNDEDLKTQAGVLSAFLKRIGLEYVNRHPLVDHRELDAIVESSKNFGFKIVELKLGDGDYESEPRLAKTINIERKAKDFIPSLFKDRHIYEQLKAMDDNDSNTANFLVVTKSWDEIKLDMMNREHPIPESVLIGYVAELCLIGYPPLFINDNEDFLSIVEKIFENYYNDPARIKRVNKAIKMRSKNIIEFPGVSDTLGERLLEKFGSIKGVCNASEDELKQVHGIGNKLAKNIFEVVNG